MSNSSKVPWVSFCLATYKRPEILARTLKGIQRQEFIDFEVVVSDNDPEQSSRSVVEALADGRFHYYFNSENVGMVKNFNAALSHAGGQYVVMMADDDPPYHDFLSTIRTLWELHPNYGAYYGACEVLIESEVAAAAYQHGMGAVKCLAPLPEGVVRCFSAEDYSERYFVGEIFPYILWSTGIVRKDIALAMGGMPDYGSPLLTDISYIAIAGSYEGCATINKVLGGQTVHGGNSGLVNPHNVEIALQGCHQSFVDRFSRRADWESLEKAANRFLFNYMVAHCIAMDRLFVMTGNRASRAELRKTLRTLSKLPYMKGIQSTIYRHAMHQAEAKYKMVRFSLLPIRLAVRLMRKLRHS